MFFAFFYAIFFIVSSFAVSNSLQPREIFLGFEIFFSIFFTSLIIKSIKRNGLVSLYTFFLLFSMFFLFSRFIFDIFGYADILYITFPSTHRVKPESGSIVIVLSFFIYTLIDIGYSYGKIGLVRKRILCVPDINYKTFLMFLLLSLPFILYKNFLRLRYVQQVGYINYTLNEDDFQFPFYLNGVGFIFLVFFWALILSSQGKHKTGVLWFLMLVVSLLDSMKGNRAAFAINFVMCIFYQIKRNNLNPKRAFRILLIAFCVFILFYFVVTSLRSGGNIVGDSSLFDSILGSLFYAQSVSLNIPLLYIDFFNQIQGMNNVPLVFADYLKFYFGVPLIDTGAILRNVLYTPKGYGLGYSVLIEIFNLGIFAPIVCVLMGMFMKFTEVNFFRNTYWTGFFCLVFMGLIYMPRHMLFGFLAPIWVAWILGAFTVVVTVDFFYKSLRPVNIRKEHEGQLC